jgi:phosphoribosylformimino-5-aminoimidazole carboxamide ribotide isomerase
VILLPAIDIREGRAVRLERGDFERETVYRDDPLEAARTWVDEGAEALHVVDLDGARAGEPRSLRQLERIAGLGVTVQYGGGLRRLKAISAALAAGAGRIVLGTAAFRDPDLLERAVALHGDRIAVGVDVRAGRASVAGWSEQTALSGEEAIAALEARGVATILYTSVDRDGMLSGPDLGEVRRAAGVVSGRLLYSGGVGSLEDLRALRSLGLPNLEGVISGKALYERRFTVAEARAALG